LPPAPTIPSPAIEAPVTLEAQLPTTTSSAGGSVWYYCPTTGSYYPYVATCAVAWQTVPTTPPQSPPQSLGHAAPAPALPQRGIADPEPRIVTEFRNSTGQVCRQLERSIVVEGTQQRAVAVVCERADGHWVISPQNDPKSQELAASVPSADRSVGAQK
jgi:hypothetical protein